MSASKNQTKQAMQKPEAAVPPSGNVQVFARVRPMNAREMALGEK